LNNSVKSPIPKGYYQPDINHQFFSEWSFDMAYILGFITADGSVTGRNGLGIAISIKDEYVLQYIQNHLCPVVKITYYDQPAPKIGVSKMCRFFITSKKIIDDLAVLGVVKNKTDKVTVPNIPIGYFGDWLRGVWDGDGCFYACKRKNRNSLQYGAHLTCHALKFLEQIKEKLGYGTIYKVNNSWRLKIGKKSQLLSLYNLLYTEDGVSHCRFCLDRKKEKLEPYLNIGMTIL
jgi:hypothetical protein